MKKSVAVLLSLIMILSSVLSNVVVYASHSAELMLLYIESVSSLVFDGSTTYDVVIPYVYEEGNFDNVTMGSIKAIPEDSNAVVTKTSQALGEIGDESIVVDVEDGDVITIEVENGEYNQTYTLNITVVGENMFEDGGFESDTANSPWSVIGTSNSRSSEVSYVGEQSLFINSGVNSYHRYTGIAAPVLKENFTYLSSLAMRGADSVTTAVLCNYSSATSSKADIVYYTYGYNNTWGAYATSLSDNWRQHFKTITPTGDFSYGTETFTTWGNSEPARYVDEQYVGELVVADIVDDEFDYEVEIPFGDKKETIIPITIDLLNQFSNNYGLENTEVTLNLIGEYPGVFIDENNIIVTDKAVESDIYVRVDCTPSFMNSQGSVNEVIKIELKADSTITEFLPMAKDIILTTSTGVVEIGAILTVDYYYYHVKNETAGETEYVWYVSDDGINNWTKIENVPETCHELTVDEEIVNKYIAVDVIPKTSDGVKGQPSRSNWVVCPFMPEAKDVKILSTYRAVGEILTGSYTYVDKNGDPQNGTTFEWIRYNPKTDTTLATGVTDISYQITDEDIDCYLKFVVIPRNEIDNPQTPLRFESESILAAATPVVSDVTINEITDITFNVDYTYEHPTGIEEGASIIEWYWNGKLISSDLGVVIPRGKSGDLKVVVTPVASREPQKGLSVSEIETVEISNGGGMSHSGGGSSGGGSRTPVVVPVPEPIQNQEDTESSENVEASTKEETTKHWADGAIAFAEKIGILNRDDFGYDEVLDRKSFVYYLVKTIGLEETPYKGIFADVSSEDYYANALQAAVDYGIISQDVLFNPHRALTREEACKVIITSIGLLPDIDADVSCYVDADSMGTWAKGYISKARTTGMMNGVSGDLFLPKGTVTFAQTATIIERIYNYLSKAEEIK